MIHAYTHIAKAEAFSFEASAAIVSRHLERKTMFREEGKGKRVSKHI